MATNLSPRYTAKEFVKLPEALRIGIVISDGMWYSLSKWKRLAQVDEETLVHWIDENLKTGRLVRSETGKRSYRFTMTAVEQWHSENGFQIDEQLVDFLWPPRIWAGMTENEGFLQAPARSISIVSFTCDPEVAAEVKEALRGIARVRQVESNHYKAYCLDLGFAREKVEAVFAKHSTKSIGKIYAHRNLCRRELVDFPKEFSDGMIQFYRKFGLSFVRNSMETINIFLPSQADQNVQMIIWVIEAMEKFNETASVPFSAYLDTALKKWPLSLPDAFLGKPLSTFQRNRSRAIAKLRSEYPDRKNFSAKEIAEKMEISLDSFNALEERHKYWLSSRAATTLTWVENSEERYSSSLVQDGHANTTNTDAVLAHRICRAIIEAALKTKLYDDAFRVISEVNASNVDAKSLKVVSPEFIKAFGDELGIEPKEDAES